MFKKLWKTFSLIAILSIPLYGFGQDIGFPEEGENPPGEVPIDGGVGFLVAAGVAYGIKKSRAAKEARRLNDNN